MVGLAGCGRWGRHVLRDLNAIGCAVAVADPDPAARAAAELAGALATSSVDKLPCSAGYVVATPTRTHARVASTLLARGAPVYVEKPLTASHEEALALTARAAGRLFVMHKWRYHDGVRRLGELARSGELGVIQGVQSSRLGWEGPHADVDPVWILAPHDLSIALEITGNLGVPRSAVLHRVGGRTLGIQALLGTAPWFSFEASAMHPVRRRELRVMGDEGVAVLSAADAQEILVMPRFDPARERPAPARRIPLPPAQPPLLLELQAFVGYLRGGPPPRSDAREGTRVVELIEALIKLGGGSL